MSIKWHRKEIRNAYGVPIMVYVTDEKDWRQWSIDREPTSNGSRTDWYEYQPNYNGEPMGRRHLRLRDAKEYVERQGRKPQ
jgi:hypothetical protein